jgi:hypothetical protein
MSFAMRFNRQAFEALLVLHLAVQGTTASQWARAIGISPGTLHEIRYPRAGRQQGPSAAMVKRLAAGLAVPVGAITSAPAAVAS